MRVVIVASGPSTRGFVPPDDVTVICVNGVIEWIQRADYWFTLDANPANLKRKALSRQGVKYYSALHPRFWTPGHVIRLNRVSMGVDAGLCLEPWVINSGNSAFGALGLAYHLGAEKVLLIGVDGTMEPRVEGGRSGALQHLPRLFDSAAHQIQMVNCGNLKARKIKKMPLDKGLEWLRA